MYMYEIEKCEYFLAREVTYSAFTCSKLTTETLEQSVKYVQC